MKIRFLPILCALVFFSGLNSCKKEIRELSEGNWRGVFQIPGDEIPFQFEVNGKTPGNISVFLINGPDRFELKDVMVRNDSVIIPIDLYSAEFRAKIEGKTLQGRFLKLGTEKPDTGLIFKAESGNLSRFAASAEKPEALLEGNWDMIFGTGAEAKNNVGSFSQKESVVTGSVLTPSGDFRFLEGTVHGKEFELSGAVIFRGNGCELIDKDNTRVNFFFLVPTLGLAQACELQPDVAMRWTIRVDLATPLILNRNEMIDARVTVSGIFKIDTSNPYEAAFFIENALAKLNPAK